MKKKIWEMSMGILLLTGIFWIAREGAKMVPAHTEKKSFLVVVDPGHGGSDPAKSEYIRKRERYQPGNIFKSTRENGKRKYPGGSDQRKG